jgi:4,5-DOPA dioxygenase extradiol
MPVLFAGHGSPMLALEQSDATRELRAVGDRVIEQFGKPKAILAISAHWYTRGTFVQTAESPKQVYDMYGFPKELYDFQYPVQGCPALGERVCELLGDRVRVSNDWGIDHGTWTVLCHMFPTADIPVVQLSVDGTISREAILEIGRQLAPLRDEGYLIFASGNVVHNLRRVEWENPNGSEACIAFNETVKEKIAARDDRAVMQYEAAALTDKRKESVFRLFTDPLIGIRRHFLSVIVEYDQVIAFQCFFRRAAELLGDMNLKAAG